MATYFVPAGVSNRHVHLNSQDMEKLFGKGAQLHPTKSLRQVGQFAAEEKVDIVGPKGSIKGLRVLGPIRSLTQIELAYTDARKIGVTVPLRESGDLEGSAGCKLIGPCGEVELSKGVIAAARHIHLNPTQAEEAGLKDHDIVRVKVLGPRALVFENVIVRTGLEHEAEFHIDTDEANAAGIKNNDMMELEYELDE